MIDRKFVYIPSFSAGAYGNAIKKNFKFRNGKAARLYDGDIHPAFYNDWFLAPAGHLYKNFEYRNQIGAGENVKLFGDSGGFQIASGAIKWDVSIREKIFKWLESQCDYSVNLDIPPRLNYQNKFDECLELSKANFKYFNDNQTGKTKFLNVMQGDTVEKYSKWCNEVKHFDFNGWCLGGVGVSLSNLMSAIAVFIDEVGLFDSKNELVHSLGTSKIIDFAILSQLQYSFNKVGSNVQVTTDSSSPNNASRFGSYYTHGDLKSGKFRTIHLPKAKLGGEYNMIEGVKGLPLTIPGDEWLVDCYEWSDINEFSTEIYCVMVLHNYGVFMNAKHQIDALISGHPYIMDQCLDTDIVKIVNIVDQMVVESLNGTKATTIFAKNKHLISEISHRQQQSDLSVSNHAFF